MTTLKAEIIKGSDEFAISQSREIKNLVEQANRHLLDISGEVSWSPNHPAYDTSIEAALDKLGSAVRRLEMIVLIKKIEKKNNET